MNNKNKLQSHLDNYLQDPNNPDLNYVLGYEYEKIQQFASAHTYYLRCAELTSDKDLEYECILKTWSTIHEQKRRPWYEKQQLCLAITHSPKRPEAYYLLSLHHSQKEEWKESLMYATLGLNVCKYKSTTKTNVGYNGKIGLLVQEAFTIWYTGRRDEAKKLWINLFNNPDITPEFKKLTVDNLMNWGYFNYINEPIIYTQDQYPLLKHKFPGSKNIKKTYSQCMQDLFALTMLDGKSNGYYIELGSGDPFLSNNTALLESLGWGGLSFDIDPEKVNNFKNQRKNLVLAKNTINTDFLKVFKQFKTPKNIDYLSLDVDPSNNTYETLLKLPLNDYKFAVITYEHNYWRDETGKYKSLSREYLKKQGYELIINDIGANENQSFEDWWVHPKLVNPKIIKKIKNIDYKKIFTSNEVFFNL